ncbi:hypothetical protein [Arsenicicoccus bolidensis]|uniref:hypothetical protein n=1 Tax=Arsenicicoccus bolidensis TaxID=229480 RepID=UPI0012EC9E02|nr:hypothetical protein [Arsenicicoccus bolidensis]
MSFTFPDLPADWELVPNDAARNEEKAASELLWRQIPPHNFDHTVGQPGAAAFGPQSSDARKPSFSLSSKVSAQAARDWHNANARSTSVGVWSCSVTEVYDAGSQVVDDSKIPSEPDVEQSPGHVFVDYRDLKKADKNLLQATLLMKALARGEIITSPRRVSESRAD